MPPRTRLNAYYSRTFKTDTEGAIESVGINGVALFSWLYYSKKKNIFY